MDSQYFDWALIRLNELLDRGLNGPLGTCFACRPFVYLAMAFAVVGVLALIKSMLFNKNYL